MMDKFVTKVRSTCQRYQLLEPGDKVIVAVSGGADSVSMLLALKELEAEYKLELAVAHLNHLMRGDAAEADANWVRELAARLKLPFYRRDTDVPALIEEGGLTVEQAGRVARYDFYRELAHEIGANKVAVGQTQDDQAETVLLHLIRGAGLRGIAGIRPKRRMSSVWVIRPLLQVTRRETEACTAAFGLTPRHDPYNIDQAYLRNRIRYRLLPWLRDEVNPNIKGVLAQSAAIWQEEDLYLERAAEQAGQKLMKVTGSKVIVAIDQLDSLPLALKRRVVRLAFSKTVGDRRNLNFEHTESLLALGAAAVGTVIHLPRRVKAWRTYDEIVLAVGPAAQKKTAFFKRRLAVPGVTTVPELGLEIETTIDTELEFSPDSLVARASFDYNEAGDNLFARNRRPGDWFYPQGTGGRKKLSDFFIDAKVPRGERDRVVLITSDEDIIWVAGQRLDERYLVRTGTKKRLHIGIKLKC